MGHWIICTPQRAACFGVLWLLVIATSTAHALNHHSRRHVTTEEKREILVQNANDAALLANQNGNKVSHIYGRPSTSSNGQYYNRPGQDFVRPNSGMQQIFSTFFPEMNPASANPLDLTNLLNEFTKLSFTSPDNLSAFSTVFTNVNLIPNPINRFQAVVNAFSALSPVNPEMSTSLSDTLMGITSGSELVRLTAFIKALNIANNPYKPTILEDLIYAFSSGDALSLFATDDFVNPLTDPLRPLLMNWATVKPWSTAVQSPAISAMSTMKTSSVLMGDTSAPPSVGTVSLAMTTNIPVLATSVEISQLSPSKSSSELIIIQPSSSVLASIVTTTSSMPMKIQKIATEGLTPTSLVPILASIATNSISKLIEPEIQSSSPVVPLVISSMPAETLTSTNIPQLKPSTTTMSSASTITPEQVSTVAEDSDSSASGRVPLIDTIILPSATEVPLAMAMALTSSSETVNHALPITSSSETVNHALPITSSSETVNHAPPTSLMAL